METDPQQQQQHEGSNNNEQLPVNIEELENRIRQLECRLFPMEHLTWDSSQLLNTTGGGLKKSNGWEEFDHGENLYHTNKFKYQPKKKASFLEKLHEIEENFECVETPLVKEFLDQIQDLNIYEYESFIEETKDLQEFTNYVSNNDADKQHEKPSTVLKKEALLNYINQQQDMIEHMSKSFEELDKLLPVVDMISDREQLDFLCNKLEDLKQFHLSMEQKHDLSTNQAEKILKQLSIYNNMVSFFPDKMLKFRV